jgi:hypothetical protein
MLALLYVNHKSLSNYNNVYNIIYMTLYEYMHNYSTDFKKIGFYKYY